MTHPHDNIRVGAITFVYSVTKRGWVFPGLSVIRNPLKAQRLAEEINNKWGGCMHKASPVELRTSNLSQQKLVHRDVLPFSLPVTPDGWISCSERMPKETGDIIVVSDGIVMSGISYSRRDGFYIAALEYDDDEPIGGVTHWMPLPEPPRLKEL